MVMNKVYSVDEVIAISALLELKNYKPPSTPISGKKRAGRPKKGQTTPKSPYVIDLMQTPKRAPLKSLENNGSKIVKRKLNDICTVPLKKSKPMADKENLLQSDQPYADYIDKKKRAVTNLNSQSTNNEVNILHADIMEGARLCMAIREFRLKQLGKM